MLRYSELEIKEILRKIINSKNIKIKPIGNHHLNRHIVYKVEDEKNSHVFKLFYKKHRWNREIASLQNLDSYGVKVNKLVDYGILSDDTEWILTEYKKGSTFDSYSSIINYHSRLKLYEQMGDELGKIHCISNYESFGIFEGEDERHTKYSSYVEQHINSMMEELACGVEEYCNIQVRAIERLKSITNHYNEDTNLRLCHNDYGKKNVIVNKSNQWNLVSVIDFEQCSPSSVYKELAFVSYSLLKDGKDFYKAFKKGYENHEKIDEFKLESYRNFYMLYTGVGLCHWANNRSATYYNKGVNLIKEFIDAV